MQLVSLNLQSLHVKEYQQKKVEERSCADKKIRAEMEGFQRRVAANSEGIEKPKKSQEEFQEGSKRLRAMDEGRRGSNLSRQGQAGAPIQAMPWEPGTGKVVGHRCLQKCNGSHQWSHQVRPVEQVGASSEERQEDE